jgi:hypothetical protein
MRWLIVLILILLAIFYFIPEPEPPTADESFIGEQIKPLRKAQGFEDEYLKATQERKKQMEEELEKSGGGK